MKPPTDWAPVPTLLFATIAGCVAPYDSTVVARPTQGFPDPWPPPQSTAEAAHPIDTVGEKKKPSPAWPDVASKVAGQRDGKRDAAVIVAVEDYAFLPDIPGAVANGEAWYQYLLHSRGVPRGRIDALFNKRARDAQIRKAVTNAVKLVEPGGRLWFIFVGHGSASAEHDGLLVGYDAWQSTEGLSDRSVTVPELLRAMSAPAVNPVVFLDACFSGLDRQGDPIVPETMPSYEIKTAVPPKVLLLTAAGNDEFAGGLPRADRPAFSYIALGALRGWADADGNGTVTAEEVQQYSEDILRQTSGSGQTPTIEGQGRRSLARSSEPEPPAINEVLLRIRTER